MKTKFLLLFFSTLVISCSSTSVQNTLNQSTQNQSAPPLETMKDNFFTAASALLPTVSSENTSSPSLDRALTYNNDTFSSFFTTYHSDLSDIFGREDEGYAVITKIRVLLRSLITDHLDILTAIDPEMDCQLNAEAEQYGLQAHRLRDSDTVNVAFLGEINNGSVGDRHFDCVVSSPVAEAQDATTWIYGSDAAGNIYLVGQKEYIHGNNTEETATRGNYKTIVDVMNVVYNQSTVNLNTSRINLDIQYAQATLYSGPDDSITSSSDNMIFKSRSRITGTVVMSSTDNSVISSNGQFNILKYDQGNEGGRIYQNYFQSLGRGSFQEGGNLLFSFKHNTHTFHGSDNIFCVQQSSSRIEATETTNCSNYESEIPYSSLGFTPYPTISNSYSIDSFFTPADLIANDASDFIVPTYSVEESI